MTGNDLPFDPRRLWLVAGLIITAIVIALQDTFATMLRLWLEIDNFNHCLLIAPISAWLIWRQRHVLARINPSTSWTGLIMVLVSAVIWALGKAASIATVQDLAAVALIPFSVWAILGTPFARVIMFPLGYLFFLVPFGRFLIPPLMGFTADMAVAAVRASGVPIYHDGLYFAIPNGSFKIIEACSGIRMLMAGVAVGTLFAYLNFKSWRRRTIFVAGVILLMIVANWMRAYLVVMMAHFSGMTLIANHNWLGYVIFAIVMVIMLLIGTRFSDVGTEADRHIVSGQLSASGTRTGSLITALAIIAIVVSTPVLVSAGMNRAAQTTPVPVAQLPAVPDGWSGAGFLSNDWSPEFHGNTTTLAERYLGPTAAVDMYIISYRSSSQQSELINETNRIFNPEQWMRIGETVGSADTTAGNSLAYIETEIRGQSGAGRLVRHWYVVDDRPYRNRVAVKLVELGNILTGRPTSAGVVVLSTRFTEDAQAAGRVLDEFMAATL